MVSLPTPGVDRTGWGTTLNNWLGVAHNADGTLKGVFTPEQYGAVGNGVADDTTYVRAAFNAANALKIVAGTYADPGATVVLSKIYNLSSLATPIDMMCNVESDGASFLIPSGYTGTAVRVGHTTSGNALRNANIEVPSVTGSTVADPGSLPTGSIGVQIRNLYTSEVKVGNVLYFETDVKVGGESHGVAYNRIMLRTLSYSKTRLLLKPADASGWVNQNTFIAGSITGSIAWEGRRNTGSFGVLLDGVSATTVTGNTFLGSSFESDVFENVIEFRNAYMNQFYGCRHEQGIAAASLTVSGDTLTSTAHVLSVNDLVCFTGSSTPTGMNFDQPYYVVAVPTADTFKVSRAKGGTAITFSSAGSGVAYSRPQRVKYDKSWDNVIDLPMGPLKWLERIEVSAVPADTAGNLIRYPSRTTTDAYSPSEWPLHRARNRYTAGASSQPLWASYTSTTNPDENPSNWIAALTAKGFNFADGAGAELGWISNLAGVLKYQKISDSVVYELASCRRIQSAAVVSSGFTVNAQSTNTFTIALTGTATSDHVLVTPVAALPAGLIMGQAYISAADTITVVLANITGSNITTGVSMSFSAVVFRRFY